MQFKSPLVLISIGFMLIMGVYFSINPSYERSLEAKFYYTIGDYEEAHKLSKEAFELDEYNRMAATIMAQSNVALNYVKYIKQSKKYIAQISSLAQGESITDAQRAKMRIISQIMMDSYRKLSATIMTDRELINEAKLYYDQFVKLNNKIDNTSPSEETNAEL